MLDLRYETDLMNHFNFILDVAKITFLQLKVKLY